MRGINEVDRANLQKEVDALKSEINRIADSANFNGINLLDGSMDVNADLTTKMDFNPGKNLPGVGETLGVDTVLHKSVADPDEGSKFSIDLHDYEFNNQKGDKMSITIGETKIEVTALGANTDSDGKLEKLTGEDLVDVILGGTTGSTGAGEYTVTVNGQQFIQGDKIVINGQDFTMAAGDSTGRLTFTQDAPPADKSQEVDPSMKVTIGGKVSAVSAKFEFTASAEMQALTDGTIKVGDEELPFDTNIETTLKKSTKFDVEVSGNKYTLTAKSTGPMEAPTVSFKANAAAVSAPTNTAGSDGTPGIYSITVSNGETVKIGGEDFVAGIFDGTGKDVTIGDVTYTVTGDLTGVDPTTTRTLTLTEKGVAAGGGSPKYTKGGTEYNAEETTASAMQRKMCLTLVDGLAASWRSRA